MALKRQYEMNAIFSMASMTDIIFLLLIFFMVTSTLVFPTALEVNLPQSSEQTAIKPTTRIYIDAERNIFVSVADEQPQQVAEDQLIGFVKMVSEQADQSGENFIAIYADETVPYGEVVKILDMGSSHGLKMVLATKAAPVSATTIDDDKN